MTSFDHICAELQKRLLKYYWQNSNQLVVSDQDGPAIPSDGNSFWICTVAGRWYLSTWLPRAYEVSNVSKLVDLCVELIQMSVSAMYSIPQELVEKYELREVADDEFEAIEASFN